MKLSIPIFSSVFGEEGQRADAFPFLQEFDFMTNFAVCYYLGHSVFLLNDAEIFLKAPLAPIYFYEEKKGAKKPNFFVRNLQIEVKKKLFLFVFCLYFSSKLCFGIKTWTKEGLYCSFGELGKLICLI